MAGSQRKRGGPPAAEPQELAPDRVGALLSAARGLRILVVGDVMLDQFIWGRVQRISPEAPVPVVEFERESFMPGGAANVARNLTALGARATLFGVTGRDDAAARLVGLLAGDGVRPTGLVGDPSRPTATKTRIVAGQQQVTRLDRERLGTPAAPVMDRLVRRLRADLDRADAVIVADYGKGVVTDALVAVLRDECRRRGLWLSMDPKPVHRLDLRGLSLITPNRKEAFELAGRADIAPRAADPLADRPLLDVTARLMSDLAPALLLVTLGEAGLLLCRRGGDPVHIPTVAREVYDVSGAGDTVIATFTLAVAAGASPVEAAVFANHAAGVVVGKFGTATAGPDEIRAGFGFRP